MTDSQLVTAIRHLVCATDIPPCIGPLDKLQVIRLLLQGADEGNVYPSQDVLSQQLGCSVNALVRSQQRLKSDGCGWLTVHSGGYRKRSNLYSINLDKLPIADLHKTVVTENARKLAGGYAKYLRKTAKRRLWRSWEQQAAFVCQKLIDGASNDLQLAMNVINYCLQHPRYRKAALRGPRALRRNWKALIKEYQAQQVSEREATK